MTRSDARLLAEFAVPAMSVGAIAAFAAGGLTLLAGQPTGWAVVTGLAMGVPMALLGGGYAVLMALQKVPTGVFAPLGAYWLIGFPLAMLVHEMSTVWMVTGSPGLPAGPLWQFFAYHALLSVGFAFGFMFAHEQFGRRWWPRIRDHNPYANRIVEEYKQTALTLEQRKEASRAARARRKKEQRAAGASSA